MIVSNRAHMLGFSHFGVVQAKADGCSIITAPEGLFKGYSTVFQTFEGEWASAKNKQLVAKAMLNPSLSRKRRAGVHRTFLDHLETVMSTSSITLGAAIDEVIATARRGGAVIDSVSKAQQLLNESPAEFKTGADSLTELLERSRRRSESDAQRLHELISRFAARLGEAPVVFDQDGKAFVHPDLARELDKPGNETLNEMLIMAARANRQRS
jgi:hypothetical protein